MMSLSMLDSKLYLLCSAEEPINSGCVDTNRQAMKPLDFFDQHPVFTHAEFAAAHSGRGRRSARTTQNILAQHVAGGRLLRFPPALYPTPPQPPPPASFTPPPSLLPPPPPATASPPN